MRIRYILYFSLHILCAHTISDYLNHRETLKAWTQILTQLGKGWKSQLGQEIEKYFDKDVSTLVKKMSAVNDDWTKKEGKQSENEIVKDLKYDLEDCWKSAKEFFEKWKPKMEEALTKQFGENWQDSVTNKVDEIKTIAEDWASQAHRFIEDLKNKSDPDVWKKVDSIVNKIKKFGNNWWSILEEKWKNGFISDWNAKVNVNLDKIQKVTYKLKGGDGSSKKEFGKTWISRFGDKLKKKFSSSWKSEVEKALHELMEIAEYWADEADRHSDINEIKENAKDLEKMVVSYLDKMKKFGIEWISTIEEKWKQVFSDDWNSKVNVNLDKIQQVAHKLKDKAKNIKKEQFTKEWRSKVGKSLDSIVQFGKKWRSKLKQDKKFTLKWKDYMDKGLDYIKEAGDFIYEKGRNFLDDLLGDGSPNWKKLRENQHKLNQKFPLPFDLDGVKINYHRQKICVQDRRGERCVSNNNAPGTAKGLQDLFRVAVEYERLANRKNPAPHTDADNSRDDNTKYSTEYKPKPGGDDKHGDRDDDDDDDEIVAIDNDDRRRKSGGKHKKGLRREKKKKTHKRKG